MQSTACPMFFQIKTQFEITSRNYCFAKSQAPQSRLYLDYRMQNMRRRLKTDIKWEKFSWRSIFCRVHSNCIFTLVYTYMHHVFFWVSKIRHMSETKAFSVFQSKVVVSEQRILRKIEEIQLMKWIFIESSVKNKK